MLELFIPERFSAYRYIISKKILAISISREHVFIVLTKITDKKRIILHTNHKNISQDESIAYDIRVGNALEEIIEKLSYDKIIFLLPSSQVIFKNIQLPFKNIEQLKMIVPFEVAATLPFSIQDSSTDCIQTNIQENNSDVLVAIAKQEYINIYREIANNIDITINKITVDGFELASSFLEQKYLNNDNSLFVILDSDLITMLCFKKKQFLTIKTISHSEYETEFSETKNKNDFIAEAIVSHWQNIKDIYNVENITQIVLLAISEQQYNEMKDLFQKKFSIEIIPFEIKNFISCTIVNESSEKFLYTKNQICNAIAGMDLPLTQDFNLAHEEAVIEHKNMLKKQLTVGLSLLLMLLSIIGIWNYFRLQNAKASVEKLEKESIQFIKNNFDLTASNIVSIERAQKEAEKVVVDLETTWLGLSSSKRYRLLYYLNTLSESLSKDLKDLRFEEISFKMGILDPDSLNLKGEVADYTSLHLLEECLRKSELFTYVHQAQDPHFTYNLTIKPEEIAP